MGLGLPLKSLTPLDVSLPLIVHLCCALIEIVIGDYLALYRHQIVLRLILTVQPPLSVGSYWFGDLRVARVNGVQATVSESFMK